jgi:hypothetical protein
MTADEARRRGLGGCRGILVALAISVPIWAVAIGVALWLMSRA